MVYANSEGQAGLMGQSLAEVLEIMGGLPFWWDCLKFCGSGDLKVVRTTATHLGRDKLKDEPETVAVKPARSTSLCSGHGRRAAIPPGGEVLAGRSGADVQDVDAGTLGRLYLNTDQQNYSLTA